MVIRWKQGLGRKFCGNSKVVAKERTFAVVGSGGVWEFTELFNTTELSFGVQCSLAGRDILGCVRA